LAYDSGVAGSKIPYFELIRKTAASSNATAAVVRPLQGLSGNIPMNPPVS
jgi:hypothetical protein